MKKIILSFVLCVMFTSAVALAEEGDVCTCRLDDVPSDAPPAADLLGAMATSATTVVTPTVVD
ncbi:MAG: hypothetical protein WAX89_02955 [Alphaproteobacteria bacterium]